MSTILVLCPYVPHPATHGGSIRSRVLLQALAQDHTVHLAAAIASAADRAAAAALGEELGIAVHELPAHEAPRADLQRKLGCWARGASELLQRRWQSNARRAVHTLRETLRPDLLVLDSSFVLPLWDHTGKALLHLHNLEHAMFARADAVRRRATDRLTRRIEATLVRRAEQRALAQASLAVTVSEDDRRIARELCPSARIEVVPNSVDLDRLPLQPPAPPGSPRLLYVGGLDYPPNLEAVTELVDRHLPVLRDAFPGLCVRLVGRDPAGVTARWRGRDGVELVGPADDLLPHYRASHAAYLPIRSGGGTRIKILEAWALGLPVLATAIGCEGLPADDGVHLRRFESPEQGLAALRDVLSGQAATLRGAGRALVEGHYSHRAVVSRLRAVAADGLTN